MVVRCIALPMRRPAATFRTVARIMRRPSNAHGERCSIFSERSLIRVYQPHFLLNRSNREYLDSNIIQALDVRFGHKRTLPHVRSMSALPPKADMAQHDRDVRFVPKADIPPPHSIT